MNRFDKKSERFRVLKGLLPVAVFCVVIGIFLSGVRSVSGTAAEQEADGLRRAVIRSAPHRQRAPTSAISVPSRSAMTPVTRYCAPP